MSDSMTVTQAAQILREATMSFADAAKYLGVHDAYVRRLADEAASEEADVDVIRIQDRPLLRVDFIERLKNQRDAAVAARIEKAAVAAEATAALKASREAAREVKAAEAAARAQIKADAVAAVRAAAEAAEAEKAAQVIDAEGAQVIDASDGQ